MIELSINGQQRLYPQPEMSWDSDSGGWFSDDSDESAIEEIVDLTLPKPLPKASWVFPDQNTYRLNK